MDQAAKPVILAAGALLVASLVTLGVKSGGDDSVAVDDDVVAGQATDAETPSEAASATPTPASESPTEEPSEEPTAEESTPAFGDDDASESPDPDATSTDDGTTDDGTTDDGTDDGSTDDGSTDDGATDDDAGQAPDDVVDLDDMPQTGGGAAVALGGLVAAGGAFGLRRRS